eukprot:jgi/Botrbrau1/10656/Bobra.53_2s0014.1
MTSDPGRAYLYSTTPALPLSRGQHQAGKADGSGHERRSSSGAPGAVVGRGSPGQKQQAGGLGGVSSQSQASTDDSPGGEAHRSVRPAGLSRWEAAMGNMEDARVALDAVVRAIDDAVYLDEDAFASLAPTTQYTRTIQVQQRRLAEAKTEMEEVRTALRSSEAARLAAEAKVAELQEELENNAVVFKMHYNELLKKDEEITRLSAVIQALSRS